MNSNNNNEEYINTYRKYGFIFTMFLLFIGIVGHFLTIFVFAQSRFRRNSSNVYFLCLAINDLLYLVIHFFKDSIKTYIEVYLPTTTSKSDNEHDFIFKLNLTDEYDLSCRLINYFRYVIRLISAYLIVSITIQRVHIIYSPFSNSFKSTKSAWYVVGSIVILSLLLNLWVPFNLEIRQNDQNNSITYCDVRQDMDQIYFTLTVVYASIKMLLPILIIFASNLVIIINMICIECKKHQLRKNRKMGFKSKRQFLRKYKRKRFLNGYHDLIVNQRNYLFHIEHEKALKPKPYFLTLDQVINRVAKKANNPKILTKLIIFISLSYALLNLPYFIIWCLYYFEEMNEMRPPDGENKWFFALKISEMFYLINYTINFYIYCLTGSVFRNQLKYSSIFFNI